MREKKYSVFWTRSAQLNLEEIIEYISSDSESQAKKIFQKIKNRSLELEQMPLRGRIVPEFREFNIRKFRELVISPWRMIYSVENNKVYVVAIFDARRDIEELLYQKLMS